MTELIRGNVKVEWVELGEGYDGDYSPIDPEDRELLRFDVSRRTANGEWEAVEDASYCTLTPADTPEDVQRALLALLMDEVYDPVEAGQSIKKLCERLSWIEPDWRNR